MGVFAADAKQAANVERARRDLLGFVKSTHPGYRAGWVHQRICSKLEEFSAAVARKEEPRLIITTMPRAGKTIIVGQRWPVWHMARHAGHEIIYASCTQKLANKSSKKARDNVARSEVAGMAYKALGAKQRAVKRQKGEDGIPLSDGIEEWTIKNGSSYQSVGVKGTINGSGAHCLIIDDYLRDRKKAESPGEREDIYEWYTSTAYQRLAPGGGVIVMATRWHSDDLIGRLLEDAKNGGDQWEVLHLPALAIEDEPIADEDLKVAALCKGLSEDEAGRPCWRLKGDALHPARFDRAALLRKKGVTTRRHGLRDWDAQYQGTPISEAGAFLKRPWFRQRWTCELSDLTSTADEVWITVDAAKKAEATSDWHACHLWGRKVPKRYLLDRTSQRVQYPEFQSMLDGFIAMHAHWIIGSGGGVLIEATVNGETYLQVRGASYKGCMLVPFKPTQTKMQRAKFLQRAAESGTIVLPDSGRHPWVEDVINEWCAFPKGVHDDDVDAASQLMMRWTLAEQVSTSPLDLDW